VPDELPERRSTGSVSDSEVADVLAALTAKMLGDVRRQRRMLARGRDGEVVQPGLGARLRGLAASVRRRLART
jgi:hypothetical protein